MVVFNKRSETARLIDRQLPLYREVKAKHNTDNKKVPQYGLASVKSFSIRGGFVPLEIRAGRASGESSFVTIQTSTWCSYFGPWKTDNESDFLYFVQKWLIVLDALLRSYRYNSAIAAYTSASSLQVFRDPGFKFHRGPIESHMFKCFGPHNKCFGRPPDPHMFTTTTTPTPSANVRKVLL